MEKMEELYGLLCGNGYLPPRNEEELLDTEKLMMGYQFKNVNRHVDAHAIINGTACSIVRMKYFDDAAMPEVPLSMAARNFEHLPKVIMEKMLKQHRKDDKDTK